MGGQPGGLHLLLDQLLLEQPGLRVEHVEVIGEAALVGQGGDIVGLLRGSHRLRGEVLLDVHRMQADQLVGNVLQRIHQGLVVLLHRRVVAGRRLAQLRTQAAAVEDRQGHRRAGAVGVLGAAEELQHAAADGTEADRGHQVDVGVEVGARHVHALGQGGDLPAAGDHIRAATEQFGRQGAGQARLRRQVQAWPADRAAFARALAGQGGEQVAGELDFFVDHLDAALGLGQRHFRLADLEMRADAAAQATLGQGEDVALLLQHGLGDVHLGVLQRELDVGADDVALQLELRLARLGGGHVGQVDGALAVAAVAPPEIELVVQADLGGVVPGSGPRQVAGAVEIVVRPAVADQRALALDLRRLDGLHQPGHGLRLAYPRMGYRQAWIAVQRLLDPGVQLRIGIHLPPLRLRPAGLAGGSLDRMVGGQGVGVERGGLGGDIACTDTTGYCGENDEKTDEGADQGQFLPESTRHVV